MTVRSSKSGGFSGSRWTVSSHWLEIDKKLQGENKKLHHILFWWFQYTGQGLQTRPSDSVIQNLVGSWLQSSSSILVRNRIMFLYVLYALLCFISTMKFDTRWYISSYLWQLSLTPDWQSWSPSERTHACMWRTSASIPTSCLGKNIHGPWSKSTERLQRKRGAFL